MERFTARKPRGADSAKAAGATQNTQETFSEMATATANRSGVVGKLLVVSLIIVSVAITAFVGYAIVRSVGGSNTVNNDQFQAVFLSDGQIYFGKLSGLEKEYAELEDIFYLQVEQQVQPDTSTDPQTQISLAKLGNELHGPEDKMFINKDQILFWENLTDDGQVVTAISNFKETGATTTPAPQAETPAPAATEEDTTTETGN